MTTDLATMSYTDLMNLQNEVKTALDSRKTEEEGKAKKEWLTSDSAKAFLPRIEELRKSYAKLATQCNKSKSTTLRVKLTVDIAPNAFDDLLEGRWNHSFWEVFNVDCGGELLNKADCGDLAYEIQERVDSVMEDVCEDAVGLHGDLRENLDDFVEELNGVFEEFNEAQSFNLCLSDLVKANKPKKAAAKKGKKK